MLKTSYIKVAFDTLGCAKNTVDTEKMQESLIKHGFKITDELDEANVIVLNTCSFIEAAAQESIDTFFEYRKAFSDKKIIVCGCLVSRFSDLPESMPEADAFVSCNDEAGLYETIINLLNLEEDTSKKHCYMPDKVSFAYVKISEGCNKMCSYCTIPLIRGKYKSCTYSEIYKEVNKCSSQDLQEVVLVAQDCGVWGCDLEKKHNLA